MLDNWYYIVLIGVTVWIRIGFMGCLIFVLAFIILLIFWITYSWHSFFPWLFYLLVVDVLNTSSDDLPLWGMPLSLYLIYHFIGWSLYKILLFMFKGMLGSYILIRTVIMASTYFMLTKTSIFNTIKIRSEVI